MKQFTIRPALALVLTLGFGGLQFPIDERDGRILDKAGDNISNMAGMNAAMPIE